MRDEDKIKRIHQVVEIADRRDGSDPVDVITTLTSALCTVIFTGTEPHQRDKVRALIHDMIADENGVVPPLPDTPEPQVGDLYRHLRKKSLYEIVAVGRHTENERRFVVYKEAGKGDCAQVWLRPILMFQSRFERVQPEYV